MTRAFVLLPLLGWGCAEPDRPHDREQSALVAPLPGLVPNDRVLEHVTRSGGRDWFAITGRDHGVTIQTQGNRAAKRYPGIEPRAGTHDIRGGKGFVTVNEGVRTASWVEHGVAYSVDVECSEAGDPRCLHDAYLLDFVSHLVGAP